MDLENPGFVKRQLMKVDMGIFYWIMSAFRAAVIAADFVLDLLFGVTIQHGSREGQSFHQPITRFGADKRKMFSEVMIYQTGVAEPI